MRVRRTGRRRRHGAGRRASPYPEEYRHGKPVGICYLGQEIIERMRSHGTQARRLVRLRMDPGPMIVLPANLLQDGLTCGRMTTLVPHPIEPVRVGLGYLKTSLTAEAGLSVGDQPQTVTVVG